MRLVTYETTGERRIGAETAEGILDLRDAVRALLSARGSGDAAAEASWLVPADMTAFLARSANDFALCTEALAAAPPAAHQRPGAVTLCAPLPRPGKVIGVGRNYGAHAAEGGLAGQEQPRLFAKFSSSVIGPGAPVIRPAGIRQLDWEVELAVVVGRPMRNVTAAEALSFVAGYTIVNDISAREFQFDVSPPQTTFAKSHDSFTPMGPVLVTADVFGDPQDVEVRCEVNGTEVQHGNTADMIFDCATILAYISRFATLEPGDVIATGTPAGVGHFRKPPIYLRPGDRVACFVAGIGTLENPVQDPA